MTASPDASLAARLTAISDAVLSGYTLRDSAAECCTDAADALERLTHDLAEAERMARLGDASTQQLRDALDRAIAADNARQRRDIDAQAEAAEESRADLIKIQQLMDIIGRKELAPRAAEAVNDAARAFVAVAKRGDLSTDTEECAHAWSALKSAVGP